MRRLKITTISQALPGGVALPNKFNIMNPNIPYYKFLFVFSLCYNTATNVHNIKQKISHAYELV
jgi:hypothetical protein